MYEDISQLQEPPFWFNVIFLTHFILFCNFGRNLVSFKKDVIHYWVNALQQPDLVAVPQNEKKEMSH